MHNVKIDSHVKANSTAYLLLAILIISVVSIPSLQIADAQTGLNKVTGFSHDLLTTGYSNNKIWALSTNGTQGTTANNWLYEVNATALTIDALYNVTRINGAQAQDMWCSPQYCYITDGNGSNTSFISAVATITAGSESKGDIIDTVNVTVSSSNEAGALDGIFSSSGSFATLFFNTLDASTQSSRSYGLVNSVPQFGSPFTLISNDGANQNGGIYNMADSTGVDRRVFAVNTLNQFRAFSLGGSSELCKFDPSLGTGSVNIFKVVAPDGTSWTGGDPALQELYINGATATGGIRIVKDTSNWLNCPTDTTNYTVDNTKLNLGSTFTLNGIILENHGIAVVQESGVSARLSIMNYDTDAGITDPTERFSNSLLIVNTNPVSSQALSGTPATNRMNYDQNSQNIFWAETGSGRAIVLFDVGSFVPPTPPPTPSQPVLPENDIPEFTGFILCIGGFINKSLCDPVTGFPLNTDPKTNGSGIAILAFLIIISYAFLVVIHYNVKRGLAKDNVHLTEVFNINPVLLLVMLIVDVGLTWYLGYIEDIIFYGVMVLLLGLAGFGIYRQVKGST